MQDRPTAVELLRAAREFCERELGQELSGRLRFQVRVLQNLLGILEREWEGEEEAVRAEWDRLRVLLGKQDDQPKTLRETAASVSEWNSELGSRIRAGDMDDRWDETVDSVFQTVVQKLAIANPRYSETSSET
jgi:hypothetical protein